MHDKEKRDCLKKLSNASWVLGVVLLITTTLKIKQSCSVLLFESNSGSLLFLELLKTVHGSLSSHGRRGANGK